MEEVWKDVVGYEDLYKVSNTGKVVSKNYRRQGKEKEMQPRKEYNYWEYYVTLTKYTKKKVHRVKNLVAEAFIPNPYGYRYISHKDGDMHNNNVDNLEWVKINPVEKKSSKYNKRYKYTVTFEGEERVFYKLKDITEFLGISTSTVLSRIRTGQLANGWLITSERTYEPEEHDTGAKTPKKVYIDDRWTYRKYIAGEEVMLAEKNFRIRREMSLEDFGNLKNIFNEYAKILVKESDDKLMKKYITNYEHAKFGGRNFRVCKTFNKLFKFQLFVRFKEHENIVEQAQYLKPKLKLFDKIIEEYEKRQRNGNSTDWELSKQGE